MSATPSVLLGEADGERIELRVLSRAHPGGLRVYDHNWLNAEAVARTAARSWRFLMYLRAEDFARFAEALDGLAAGRRRDAEFDSVDGWLTVEVEGGADGAFALAVGAREGHTEKVARVRRSLAAADLARLAREIRAVADAYPVIT